LRGKSSARSMPVIPALVKLVEQLEKRLTVSSDDFSVYNGYPVTAQQKCLAHLRRHFKKVVSLSHGNNPVGASVLGLNMKPLGNIGRYEKLRM